MSKIKIAKALTAATGNLEESHACVQALEEDEREREIKYEKLITQMHRDSDRIIAKMHRDNEKLIDSVQRELQLQNKHLRFLSWAIPAATAFLVLMMAGLGVVFVIFGAG